MRKLMIRIIFKYRLLHRLFWTLFTASILCSPAVASAPLDHPRNQAALAALLNYAESQHTSGLTIIHNGRLIVEANWPVSAWRHPMFALSKDKPTSKGIAREDVASLQKSLVSLLMQRAVSENLIALEKPVSNYLGSGWSAAPVERESNITVRHLLSMSSGLDDDLNFVEPPGMVWRYNTAAYAQLIFLLERVSGQSIAELSQAWVFQPAGMIDSAWQPRHWVLRTATSAAQLGLYTTAPDLARMGLWVLNSLPDNEYIQKAVAPSQSLNPAYGYLWWLNGYPLRATSAQASSTQVLIPSAPGDLIAGRGFLDRKLYIVPSLKLVVARIGSKAEENFESRFWQLLMQTLPAQREQCRRCNKTVADTPTRGLTHDNHYIAWREHIIDDSNLGPRDLAGGDGLLLNDLDRDGYLDIVSVHESDTEYDGQSRGYVRVAWGSSNANKWELETLAEGAEVAAAEDLALADFDGDGDTDIVVASELAPLLYIENPGIGRDAAKWPRQAIEATRGRGSFIRVDAADFDGDGRPELIAANKGAQNPDPKITTTLNPISLFKLPIRPMQTEQWKEVVIGKLRIPINAKAVDMDNDGDFDILAGSRGESRVLWYENQGDLMFVERPIRIMGLPDKIQPTGFKLNYVDIDKDGIQDILLVAWPGIILKLSPRDIALSEWHWRKIADILPDRLVSIGLGDIDSDGDLDILSGSYSDIPRDRDDPLAGVYSRAGQIAWFENPGDSESAWTSHPIVRRKRGMYDAWVVLDIDKDGDLDALGTRGNSYPFDGVFWLEQIRTRKPQAVFSYSRSIDSQHIEGLDP